MKHIGFIMDGNRTWAKENGLSSLEWHRCGYNIVENIIDSCLEYSLEYASFWALSDDNIRKRTKIEVKYLFDLLTDGINRLISTAKQKNIRLYFVGDRKLLRADCLQAICRAEEETTKNRGLGVIFAIGYGGQEEIVRAIQNLAKSGKNMENISADDLIFASDTGKFPPPDLIVRTGGHLRHSGYFLLQSPYAEYFFSQKNWPEFDKNELFLAMESFAARKRKFGK